MSNVTIVRKNGDPPREATALPEKCCNRNMKPDRVLLRSKTEGYAFDLLRRFMCKVCGHVRADYSRFTASKKGKLETMTEAKPITPKSLLADWLPRLQPSWQYTPGGKRVWQTDVIIEMDAPDRQTRGKMHVSQDTMLRAADTAKVYKAILNKAFMNVG